MHSDVSSFAGLFASLPKNLYYICIKIFDVTALTKKKTRFHMRLGSLDESRRKKTRSSDYDDKGHSKVFMSFFNTYFRKIALM